MRKKGSLHILQQSTVMLLALLFLTQVSGCATGGWWGKRNISAVSRYFDEDATAVWDALNQAVQGISVDMQNKEEGTIVTEWVKGKSSGKKMGLLLEGRWHIRYRLFIKMDPQQDGGRTYVSVNSQVEEKAPGGSRAFRWERTTSGGVIEKFFLDKLERILKNR